MRGRVARVAMRMGRSSWMGYWRWQAVQVMSGGVRSRGAWQTGQTRRSREDWVRGMGFRC